MAILFQFVMGATSGTLAAGIAARSVSVTFDTSAARVARVGPSPFTAASPSTVPPPPATALGILHSPGHPFRHQPSAPRHSLLTSVYGFFHSAPGLAVVGIALAAATYFSGESSLTLLAAAVTIPISRFPTSDEPSGLFDIKLHKKDGTQLIRCDQSTGKVYSERDGNFYQVGAIIERGTRFHQVGTIAQAQHIQDFIVAVQDGATQTIVSDAIGVTSIEVMEVPLWIARRFRTPNPTPEMYAPPPPPEVQ